MAETQLGIKRKRGRLVRDNKRVISRLYMPGDRAHNRNILRRICTLSPEQVSDLLDRILFEFSDRHKNIEGAWEHNCDMVLGSLGIGETFTPQMRLLIGAYFTMEYSIESAGLFNPSMVAHPDQSGLDGGALRFILSLRATGEGHISSIEFRSGTIDARNNILFDPVSDFVEAARVELDPSYNTHLFQLKLNEMAACNEITSYILEHLPDEFSFSQLQEKTRQLQHEPVFDETLQNETLDIVFWLARSNYALSFHPQHKISERVIFPVSENESSGIEDARFVRFTDDDGSATYYATYTAYNGIRILPQLIETKDFITFKIITLNGLAVQNKGMALFPRRIKGQFVMLSRQDGQNNHIMFSDNIHFWQKFRIIQEPERPWEFIQVGNCGSPLETDRGWLVLTHGVGPMRKYCIGAMLLDLDNPAKIRARTPEPILHPDEKEREGYVPNVVYSCGSLIHHDELIIPYAMSDITSGIATAPLQELLDNMESFD